MGLSLAELFLIMLFLLLLVSIGVSAVLSEEKEEVEEFADRLTVIDRVYGSEITVEDFTLLVKDAEDKETLAERVQEASDQLAAVEEVVGEDAMQRANEKVRLEHLEEENQELTSRLSSAVQEILDLDSQLSELEKDIASSSEILGEFEQVLDNLSGKGQHPPCWFVLVPDETEPGALRQRHIKIFDVRISDNGFTVRPHDNSNLAGSIDKGNEVVIPELPNSVFHRELSTNEFEENFSSFHHVGISKQIRSYSCKFMVDVYDATSSFNKTGYKAYLRSLEQLFYKFEEISGWDRS